MSASMGVWGGGAQPVGLLVGVLQVAKESLKSGDLGAERATSLYGDLDPGASATAAGGAPLGDEASLLQGLQVPAEVPVGDSQVGLEGRDVDLDRGLE